LAIISSYWDYVGETYQLSVRTLALAWERFQPHLQWIGPLFGIAMAAWRWWDRREAVVWRRAMRLLGDQGRYVQDCCRRSLAAILYPGPATPVQRPAFAVPALRQIFARRWWSPLRLSGPIKWAEKLLGRTHVQLDYRDDTIALHRSFAIAQRYAAHVLQGAFSAARANGKDLQERNRLNQIALDCFDAALALEGKGSDAILLELRCLQLRKLDRDADACDELRRLEDLLTTQLKGVTPLTVADRQALLVQLIRICRYQAEVGHTSGAHVLANAHLLGLMQNPGASAVFQNHLEFHDRLERACFHEVHACARVKAFGIAANGVALQSLAAARNDYNALIAQVDPRRFRIPHRTLRWLRRSERKDGTGRLRVAAKQGLQRLQDIHAGKGCQFCESTDTAPSPGPGVPIAPIDSAG
jgi:hypothetical protein